MDSEAVWEKSSIQNAMKELIKKVLEGYKGSQFNIDSDAAIKILADDIEKTVKKKYYVFKINELTAKENE